MIELSKLEDSLASATDQRTKTQLLDQFWDRVLANGTPIVENDSTVTFVYRGPGERVRVSGDMTHWGGEISLERVQDTDLFAKRVTLPSDARIEYLLLVDNNFPGPDPNNPYKVLNGLGGHSELAMPAYDYHPELVHTRDGSYGGYDRVTQHMIPPGIMGYEKEIHVYTPPGYDAEEADYPSVYIMDGRDYIEYGHIPAVLDGLIEQRVIEPLIAVFVAPPNRHQPAEPNRTTEYGLNPDYPTWMADELVPFVEAEYRVRQTPTQRMVVGDSYAGLVSVYIPFERPDVFGIGYSQSGYVSLNKDALIKRYAEESLRPIRLYVDVGIYEETVGKGWLPDDEIDFTAGNRRFRKVLESRGYDFQYREYAEGHTWGNWRRHLIDGLIHFFPTKQ